MKTTQWMWSCSWASFYIRIRPTTYEEQTVGTLFGQSLVIPITYSKFVIELSLYKWRWVYNRVTKHDLKPLNDSRFDQ